MFRNTMRHISKFQVKLIVGWLTLLFLVLDESHWRSRALLVAPQRPRLYTTAQIDYTGANEYVEAHYGISDYFDVGREKVVMEPILDARSGIINVEHGCSMEPSIELCGFQLIDASTNVTTWENTDQIRRIYLPQLKLIMENVIYPR